MNPLSFIYNEILFRPLFNLLVAITNILPNHNVGLSILGVTLLVRFALLPLSIHQAHHMQANQKKMAALRAEIKKINEQYKNDSAKKAQATMELYKKAGISPTAGCLPLVIQLPILIAMYRVFLGGLGEQTWSHLYSFVHQPTAISMMFLGINLAVPSVLLGLIAGVAQFLQMRLMSATQATPAADADETSKAMHAMQRNMAYIFPVMTVFIALKLPAALALYWCVSTLFGLLQQYIMKRTMNLSSAPPIS